MPGAGPAGDLAGEIVAGLAEALEADRAPVDLVQARQHVVHRVVHRRTLGRSGPRNAGILHHPTVQRFHDVEQRADDGAVLAQVQHARYGHVSRREGVLYPEFAIDRVRRGQEFARRLLAQDHVVRRELQPIGGVRLSAADPLDPHPPIELRQAGFQVALQPVRIEIGQLGQMAPSDCQLRSPE